MIRHSIDPFSICLGNEWAVAQTCSPVTLQPEQSGRLGSIPSRAQPLERHDKGL